VSAAVVTITEVRSELAALEAQLRSVNLLGATPLASSADAVRRIADSMDGLETQIPVVADGLKGNRDALAGNAAALGELADGAASLAGRLGPSVGQDSLDDMQQVITLTLLMFAAWAFVPALAALGLGAWLRREPA
jgi:ABC-type transporter Mla subunit MlaD